MSAHERYTRGTGARPRSAAARLEAALERDWTKIEARMGRALAATRVYTDPYKVRDSQGDTTTATLAVRAEGEAASRVSEVLAERARALGIGDESVARAEGRWRGHAREDVRRWSAATGPWPVWEQALEAVRRLGESAPRALSLSRWAMLARGGVPLAERLGEAEPWLAGEAALRLDASVLARPVTEWRRALVRASARALGRKDPIGDADADAALAHWRWPGARPPLGLAGVGAGVLAPLESDSAWSNALEADTSKALGRDPLEWARAVREGEEAVGEAVTDTVRDIALRWARGAGEDEATLARWEEAWGGSPRLPGEGRRIAPVFAPGARRAQALGWNIPIEAPGRSPPGRG